MSDAVLSNFIQRLNHWVCQISIPGVRAQGRNGTVIRINFGCKHQVLRVFLKVYAAGPARYLNIQCWWSFPRFYDGELRNFLVRNALFDPDDPRRMCTAQKTDELSERAFFIPSMLQSRLTHVHASAAPASTRPVASRSRRSGNMASNAKSSCQAVLAQGMR